MKWSRSMRARMIVIAVTAGMFTTIQPEGAPGSRVQEKTMESVTRCGSSSGMGFFFPGGFVPSDQTGWQKDTISSGQILLIYDDGKPDIIYTAARDRIQSARAEGATVVEVDGGPPGFRLILAIYHGEGTIMHYLFGLDEDGAGAVAWGTIRANASITKSSLYTASCQAP